MLCRLVISLGCYHEIQFLLKMMLHLYSPDIFVVI